MPISPLDVRREFEGFLDKLKAVKDNKPLPEVPTAFDHACMVIYNAGQMHMAKSLAEQLQENAEGFRDAMQAELATLVLLTREAAGGPPATDEDHATIMDAVKHDA